MLEPCVFILFVLLSVHVGKLKIRRKYRYILIRTPVFPVWINPHKITYGSFLNFGDIKKIESLPADFYILNRTKKKKCIFSREPGHFSGFCVHPILILIHTWFRTGPFVASPILVWYIVSYTYYNLLFKTFYYYSRIASYQGKHEVAVKIILYGTRSTLLWMISIM